MKNKIIKCCKSCRFNGCACTNRFVSDMNDPSLWDIRTDYCSKFEEIKEEKIVVFGSCRYHSTSHVKANYIEKDKIRDIINRNKLKANWWEFIVNEIEELIK